jgi:cell division septation protein DedD
LARNDEGEFELVLGNRQLISVFLIVVILLGVFFSMGYIVGRNSSPTDAARNSAIAKSVEPPSPVPSAASPQASAPVPETKSAPPERVTTHAEQPPTEAPPPKPTPVSPAKEKRSPSPPPAPARSERASVTGEPPAGDYWQVVATARPDAEIVAEALGKKGMHAIVAPAPKEGIFRVLVGPLKDSAAQAQTRTDLEAAGFKNPIVRKY